MHRWIKPGIVIAGYLLAFAVSVFMVALDDRQFSPADNQAMGGMIAGGEMMYGSALFVLFSLAPTGLALWFLRHSRKFWSAFSSAGLAFAIVGLVAVLAAPATEDVAARLPLLLFVELLSLAQMLGSPLWIGSFALFAALAPARDLRRRMLVALAIEVVIAAFGLVHFLVPLSPI